MDLDLDNIQGNIVPGFSKDHQAFVFVRFRGGQDGSRWLAAIQPDIASANEVQGFKVAFKSLTARRPHPAEADGGALTHVSATWVNLALSFSGLRLLPGAGNVERFPQSFKANRVPGADPASAQGDVHAVLIVAGDLTTDLDAELDRQRQRMAEHGVDEVKMLRGDTLPGDQRGHEHFGFKDAISQPQIAGTSWGTPPPVAAGEFILGLPDQTGQPAGASLPEWTRNGSFLAFLQLQQHVATFWSAMKQSAQQFGVQPEDVAAWIVGRKHDAAGSPVAPQSAPPARVSHIGRAYSRWLPPAEAARHRIIRRGIPYGAPWQEGQKDDDDQRGLLFVAYQADPQRQFEHVWTQWLNSPAFPLPGAGRDALVGQTITPATGTAAQWNSAGKRPAVASRAGQTGGIISLSLPAFVTPLYGGYFFAPAIDALSCIASVAPTTSTSTRVGESYGSATPLRPDYNAHRPHRPV